MVPTKGSPAPGLGSAERWGRGKCQGQKLDTLSGCPLEVV